VKTLTKQALATFIERKFHHFAIETTPNTFEVMFSVDLRLLKFWTKFQLLKFRSIHQSQLRRVQPSKNREQQVFHIRWELHLLLVLMGRLSAISLFGN